MINKIVENWKSTEWPQTDLGHLTVKVTLDTFHTYPWGPNFHAFCGITNLHWYKRLQKIRNALNDLRMTLNNCQKYLAYTEYSPRAPYFYAFISASLCETQSCQKSEKHRMTSDWPWSFNCQRYPAGTEYLPQRTIFVSPFDPFWENSSFGFTYMTNGEREISAKKSGNIAKEKKSKIKTVPLWG